MHAIRHFVIFEPHPVFLLHGGGDSCRVSLAGLRGTEDRIGQHGREPGIAFLREQRAIERQRLPLLFVPIARDPEKIDEAHAVLRGDLLHGFRVKHEVRVLGLAIRRAMGG